jgi:hypothetical protein
VEVGFPGQTRPVLLRTAEDLGVRLRHIAVSPGITERSMHGIVTDPTAAHHVVHQEDGRRNRYRAQARHLLPACQPGTCHRKSRPPGG